MPAKKQPVLRKDYAPPSHVVDDVALEFELGEEATTVRAELDVRRTGHGTSGGPLLFHGEGLELRSVRIDGAEQPASAYTADAHGLTLRSAPDRFRLQTEVVIDPRGNTALEGLYFASGIFCTQCEPEGFRRITYFPDRPDVMARYRVRIVADAKRYPVLLSNGNRLATEDLGDGRHAVDWEDPFPKPSYLFALVAGDLRCQRGEFVTRSGRTIALEIWVEQRNVDRCAHALHSLQEAMRWDEEQFGLEIDLDQYMIVAVNDFNMGAMENKGLNIFNSKYVLANPATATDDDYDNILGVIGHEYFHNWTGNRVTCRDWFQLTLKEGLTVCRDQLFSETLTSAPVERIAQVRGLRTVQFPEDEGPMQHPVRPESYVEMNNFYTATVYNKGAEVVRMYRTLFGPGGFRRGMDLYFERHDGQAVTCDDFRAAMADANGADLTQFERWYDQAGTPVLAARGEHDAAAGTYSLTLRQSPRTPAGAPGRSYHLPVRLGLLGDDGRDLPLRLVGEAAAGGTTRVLELREEEQTFVFADVERPPVPSLLRGFSAPVKLELERSREELAFLAAHDSDPFNRWDAGQTLAQDVLLELARDRAAGRATGLDPRLVAAFARVLEDPELDGSLKAMALTLPSERMLGQALEVVDVDGIHGAREQARRELAAALRERWEETLERTAPNGPYSTDRAAVDRRRLRCLALAYLACLDEPETTARVHGEFERADNMTVSQATLAILCDLDRPERERALASFHGRWKDDPLVVDKWFAVQALSRLPATVEHVRSLARHPDFRLANPNRARSLLSTFAQGNQARFHEADGSGYAFVREKILELDALNPQTAAGLVKAFQSWRRFDAGRQEHMRGTLEAIAAHPGLSDDAAEIAGKSLGRDVG